MSSAIDFFKVSTMKIFKSDLLQKSTAKFLGTRHLVTKCFIQVRLVLLHDTFLFFSMCYYLENPFYTIFHNYDIICMAR